MRPYFVEYTVTAVVMAEDENDAWSVARSERRDVFRDADDMDIFVRGEVTGEKDLDDSWDLHCVPYGGDGKTRIGELINPEAA